MALELGLDFGKRWLAAPDVVRQQVYNELGSICRLLEPQTDFAAWQTEHAKLPTLQQVMAEAIRHVPAATTQLLSTPTADSQLPLELKKRFLREADDLIEQALDPIRQQLRAWLHAEMQRLLAEQQSS